MGGKEGVLSALYSFSWLEWGCAERISAPRIGTRTAHAYLNCVLPEETGAGVASGKAASIQAPSFVPAP